MPYKRKRRVTKKSKSAYSMAKKALKISKKISSQIEIKHYDLDFNGSQNLDWNGLRINLNVNIPQGLTDSQRVGDKIKMVGNRLHFGLFLNGNAQSIIRCILMYDKENSIEFATDFLEVTGSTSVVYSPYDVDDRHRYIILHDKVYSMSTGNTRRKFINFSKKLNKTTQYEGGTTSVAKGILRLWIFADNDSTLINPPLLFNGYSRIWYQDS